MQAPLSPSFYAPLVLSFPSLIRDVARQRARDAPQEMLRLPRPQTRSTAGARHGSAGDSANGAAAGLRGRAEAVASADAGGGGAVARAVQQEGGREGEGVGARQACSCHERGRGRSGWPWHGQGAALCERYHARTRDSDTARLPRRQGSREPGSGGSQDTADLPHMLAGTRGEAAEPKGRRLGIAPSGSKWRLPAAGPRPQATASSRAGRVTGGGAGPQASAEGQWARKSGGARERASAQSRPDRVLGPAGLKRGPRARARGPAAADGIDVYPTRRRLRRSHQGARANCWRQCRARLITMGEGG